MTLRWDASGFKAKLTGELMANAEIVGEFVESEARKRLLGIQDPDWGAAYRGYVARLMDNEVVREGNGITIRVGVGRGRSGSHHGLYIELGSRTAAAHPFLRPSVIENAAKIVALLGGQ